VRFELSAEEIAEALAEESVEVAAPEDIPVPDALLPAEEVQALVAERRPAYVPVDGGEAVRRGFILGFACSRHAAHNINAAPTLDWPKYW